jgi:hypothetical protein
MKAFILIGVLMPMLALVFVAMLITATVLFEVYPVLSIAIYLLAVTAIPYSSGRLLKELN